MRPTSARARKGTLRPEQINRIGAAVHRSTNRLHFFSRLAFQAAAAASPQPPEQENCERIILLPILTVAPFLLFV
jgi:hypothetical protein